MVRGAAKFRNVIGGLPRQLLGSHGLIVAELGADPAASVVVEGAVADHGRQEGYDVCRGRYEKRGFRRRSLRLYKEPNRKAGHDQQCDENETDIRPLLQHPSGEPCGRHSNDEHPSVNQRLLRKYSPHQHGEHETRPRRNPAQWLAQAERVNDCLLPLRWLHRIHVNQLLAIVPYCVDAKEIASGTPRPSGTDLSTPENGPLTAREWTAHWLVAEGAVGDHGRRECDGNPCRCRVLDTHIKGEMRRVQQPLADDVRVVRGRLNGAAQRLERPLG